jgi:hypothetical protein
MRMAATAGRFTRLVDAIRTVSLNPGIRKDAVELVRTRYANFWADTFSVPAEVNAWISLFGQKSIELHLQQRNR